MKVRFSTGLRVLFALRLVVSERTGMSVVSHNGDVFAPQKLAINASMEGRGANQQRVLCVHKTRLFPTYTDVCREKVYTEVHFWTGYLQKRWKGGAFITSSLGALRFEF